MNNSALVSFPYRQDSAGHSFPIIPVRFHIPQKDKIVDSSALIDSGATISIFKIDVAWQLGIEVEKGKEIIMGGVGGRIKGYLHEIEMEVSGKKFNGAVIFSQEYTVSFNLLGRQDFFRNFKIIFDEKNKKVELI